MGSHAFVCVRVHKILRIGRGVEHTHLGEEAHIPVLGGVIVDGAVGGVEMCRLNDSLQGLVVEPWL